jgi:predicted DCC family thiol-disulfide oxidoreductase YuxK
MAEKRQKAVLIYDGSCPVCKKTVTWIRENMRKDSFEMLPCQSEEVRQRFPSMKRAVCMQAMQLILPDGQVLAGEKALPEIIKRLRRYSPAAALFSLPGSEILSRSFYRWFADNRYHIAGILFPEKEQKEKENEEEEEEKKKETAIQ